MKICNKYINHNQDANCNHFAATQPTRKPEI
jgi:hypothetical protein